MPQGAAGHVAVETLFVGNLSRTRVQLTARGRRAFERYVEFLKGILDENEEGP
jgi:Winged helix DNA-binding domain